MKKIKTISSALSILLLDILVLIYQMYKQLVLPNPKRKGNLITTLFLFFTSLTEKIIKFEKSLIGFSWLSKMNYIRKAVFIISWALFVLSFIEWSQPQTPVRTPVAFNLPTSKVSHFVTQIEIKKFSTASLFQKNLKIARTGIEAGFYSYLPCTYLFKKRYLTNQVFRI